MKTIGRHLSRILRRAFARVPGNRARVYFWKMWLREGYWDTERHGVNEWQRRKHDMVADTIKNIASNAHTMHELGCGAGYNLARINEQVPDLELSGNDLNVKICLEKMSPHLQSTISLIEMDTLSYLRQQVSNGLRSMYCCPWTT